MMNMVKISVGVDKRIIYLMLSHFTGLPPDEIENRIRNAVQKVLDEARE